MLLRLSTSWIKIALSFFFQKNTGSFFIYFIYPRSFKVKGWNFFSTNTVFRNCIPRASIHNQWNQNKTNTCDTKPVLKNLRKEKWSSNMRYYFLFIKCINTQEICDRLCQKYFKILLACFFFCCYFTASQRACKEVNLETIKKNKKNNNNNHKKIVSDFVCLAKLSPKKIPLCGISFNINPAEIQGLMAVWLSGRCWAVTDANKASSASFTTTPS